MRPLALPFAAGLLLAGPLAAAPPESAGVEFFEKKVRPVLVEHCYACHGEKKQRGGLRLDTRAALREGGDSGPALVPGKPDESLLLKVLRQAEDVPKMPPKGQLPAAVIADLAAWVKLGAPDPRDGTAPAPPAVTWDEMLRTRRQWWSLQPVRKPEVPAVGDSTWPLTPIDRFLLAALETKGLHPAPDIDRRTLIRRLSLVLTGLPPTPEEVEAARNDNSPDWYEKFVDRLLASPHFGERWARHWLDVVRFTETHGNEWNYEVHHAWRYRDYLIRAFNDDVHYDQLVREHIAGDLLPPRWNKQEQINEAPIGTAFYRFGEVSHDDCIGLRQLGYDIADNQIDTLTKAFQATTVACARCHDHKIDAVSMQDYYALLGVLRSSRLVSHTLDAGDMNTAALQKLVHLKEEIREEIAVAWQRDVKQISDYLNAASIRILGSADSAKLISKLDSRRLDKLVASLQAENAPLDDPLTPWRMAIARAKSKKIPLVTTWSETLQLYQRAAKESEKEAEEIQQLDADQFKNFGDFRSGWRKNPNWGFLGSFWPIQRDLPPSFGHWIGNGIYPVLDDGDFALFGDGDEVVRTILPRGDFTHTLSDRLGGTLRSKGFPTGKKHISFQVLGRRGSAVRLVSNNCQLNYKNYRALTSDELQWVTFSIPEEAEGLRVYAELTTMLYNPKFPDQLSSLGGDKENYRIPWEEATANSRSYFGVTRVAFHDTPEPPRPDLSHVLPLFNGKDHALRFAEIAKTAIEDWAQTGTAIKHDVRWLSSMVGNVRWLDSMVHSGLLPNSPTMTPKLGQLVKQYRAIEQSLILPRIVPGLADAGPGFDQPIFTRGDCLRPGEPAPRRYLEVLSKSGERFPSEGSGRLQLAEMIASADNPLTARVMVNRVWHHLFGAGLVRTVDDFGRIGELPSHPELLDYLADRFVKDGWSVKRLIRSLVLSRAFRTASQPSEQAKEVDPENRLLQHYPARRLEAEAIRDAILAASGRLDRRLYGLSVQPFRVGTNPDRRLFPGPLDGNGRRSVYIKNNLMEAPYFLSAFDFPGGKVTQGRRDVTNVPAQALALLNDPFVLQQAETWAERLVVRTDADVGTRIDAMFRTALGRPPAKEERQRFERTVGDLAALHGVAAGDVLRSKAVWQDVAHALFNVQEFIFVH